MKILFTTPILEHPAAGGPQLRIENSIKALHSVAELHIVSRVSSQGMGGPDAEQFFRNRCHVFSYAPSAQGPANRYLRKMRAISLQLIGKWDIDYIISYADTNQIEVVWFGFGTYERNKKKATSFKNYL